jgi:cytosine/uracil/thiamine/allantoin permease
MNLAGGLFDIIGVALAIVFILYWACAGRIVIEKERNWIFKILLLAALVVYPVFTPLAIYIVYYRHVIPIVKGLFRPKARNMTSNP